MQLADAATSILHRGSRYNLFKRLRSRGVGLAGRGASLMTGQCVSPSGAAVTF
jgi:hypothetical protein